MMLSICTTTYADNWMQYLPDNAYVVDVSIPGSHDTATGNGWTGFLGTLGGPSNGTTQDITLEEQWKRGARAFDLRPKVNGSRLAVNHGILQTKLYFDDAIRTICGFLKDNPTEFVVIHMLYADGFDSDKAKYQTMLRALLNSNDVKDYLVDFRKDLTVKEMRGKMLIISRDPYDTAPYTGGFFNGWGNGVYRDISISGKSSSAPLKVQDESSTNGITDKKNNLIREFLDYSTKHVATSADDVVWTFNMASAYANSGTSTSDGYRENATYTHPTFIDYLKENPAGPTGVVLMDYLGVDNSKGYGTSTSYNTRGLELLNTIIDNNYRYLPKINSEGKTISVPYYTYKTTGWTSTTGNTFHVNTWSTEGITDGSGMVTPFFENWLNSGGRLGNGEIYYTLSECEQGYYKVTIKTRMLNEAGGATISGASIFANDSEMKLENGRSCTNGMYSNYSIIGKANANGELRFGFKINNATFNWISFKDIDVEYLGDNDKKEEFGSELLNPICEKSVKEAYKKAQDVFAADPSMDTYNAMSKAYRDAEPSIAEYEKLKKALDFADEKYQSLKGSVQPENEEAYNEIINKVQAMYSNGEYADSEIEAVALPEVYAAIAALLKSTGNEVDMTSFIVNNSFEAGYMLGWSVPYSSSDTGVREQSNDTYKTTGCDGKYLFNTYWQGVPVTQTITGLPNGRYRLDVLVASDGATVYLIANGGHNEGTETGGSYPGKDIFQDASYEFDVTDHIATIGVVGSEKGSDIPGDHKEYDKDGYWWYKADNFRLTLLSTISYTTITEAEYTAYVTPYDVDFTQTNGLTAYKVTEASTKGAKLEEIESAPKGTAVILHGAANNYTVYQAKNAVDAIDDNKFLPGGSTSGNGTTIYALGNKDGVGFYLVKEGVEVPANKGYLEITDNNPVEGIKAFIPFGDTATGIESITAEDDNEESTIYNIAGQRVGKGYKGIVIDKNGKKYLNK